MAIHHIRDRFQRIIRYTVAKARRRYIRVRRKSRRIVRQTYASMLMQSFVWQQRVAMTGRVVFGRALNFLATLMSLVIAGIILFAGLEPDSFTHVSETGLAAATIIGGALALVLSLSIIPAQKAAEAFSSAILRLYARDLALLSTFGLLVGTTMASVLIGAGLACGLTSIQLIAAQFALLGVSFDGLRLFYRKTLNLLIADTAVALVVKQCERLIKRTHKSVHRLTRIFQIADNSSGGISVRRAVLFEQSQIAQPLRAWIGQLDEFAHKAIARGDTEAVNTIITAMHTIGTHYIEARRTSIVLLPDWQNPFDDGVSDITKVLNPIYESIRVICQHASKDGYELVVTTCIKIFGDRTVRNMSVVHEQQGRWPSAPLAHAPCFYLDLCVKIAIRADMADAVLASVVSLQNILMAARQNIDTSTAEASALEALFNIAKESYGKPNSVWCFPAVSALLFAAQYDIQLRGYRDSPQLKKILGYALALAPAEVLMEKAGKRILSVFPPYSLGFEGSLPVILHSVAHLERPVGPLRPMQNPLSEFMEASQDIVRHYRELAKVDFQDALLRKWVIDSLVGCAKVHIEVMRNPPPGSDNFLEEVEGRLRWFVHTLSFFFPRKNPFPNRDASEAASALAALGIQLLENDYPESARACGAAIGVIASNCVTSDYEPYSSADVYQNLEILGRAAALCRFNQIAVEFRGRMAKPPEASEDNWATHLSELQTRLGQLDDELQEVAIRYVMQHGPVEMLKALQGRQELPPQEN